MNQVTFVLLLLWTSATTLASESCGVPAIKPKVPGCPTDGFHGIVNGEVAVPHSWPWQVSFQGYSGWHHCGGSLINENWVVTAAHCNVNSTSHSLTLGRHNRKNTKNVQIMKIGKVFNHPYYRRNTLDYDIALIKLQSPAQMNKHVSPVCVAETSDIFYAGMNCVATGWGYQQEEAPLKLQQGCLPLIGYDKCKSYWGSFLTSQMICAGATRSRTCQGDSGGPLVCEKNGAWTLVGVTSWVKPGCITAAPAGFARITALRAWMDQTMANN